MTDASPVDADLATELDLALRLADLADAITLPAYEARRFSTDRKADRSEVTEIDRACEQLRARTFALDDPNDRQRALGYLSRKGYAAEDAYEAVRQVARDEGLDLSE